jgi:gliding motility-associated-like protein
MAYCLQSRGQVQSCKGSLGDPVINETFGSGANPGPPINFLTSTLKYTASNCPEDGYYTILNSLPDSTNCHPYTWYPVPHDHTGDPNGYMMLINADYDPSVFFTQEADGLCPNTTYFFSAWILNLCLPSLLTVDYSQPNITFSVQTKTGGILLATDTTGTIPPSPYSQGPIWVQYGVFFTTPADLGDVVVVMTNNAPGGNGNDFIMDDITFRACGPIIAAGFSSAAGIKNESLCQGQSAAYVMKAQVVGNNTPAYQWQASIDTGTWTDIPGATADSLVATFSDAQPNTYHYRLGVANGSGVTDAGCRVYAAELTVNVNPIPVVPPIPDQLACEGEPLQLMAAGAASYTWTGPGITPTSKNPLIINNVTLANNGTYTVIATSDSGCAALPVAVQVKVVPKVVAAVDNASAIICAGEGTQLMASGGLYYKWLPSAGLDNDTIANPVAKPLQSTIYTVYVSNGGCTDSSKSVTVTVNQNPVAEAGKEIFLFEGQSAKLNGVVKGDSITSYHWSPATFLSNATSLTPITTPTENITYTLTVQSATCGIDTSSVYVRVYQNITIPNTFSPNNDGINDVWDIKSLDTYPESVMQVFDRWGRQVFESTGYPTPWNGTYNGNPLHEGTYYYIIDLKIGTPKISGWVLIVK